MNSKSLVFAVFAVWCIICWRWYVCGLMNACEGGSLPDKDEVVAVHDNRLDTLAKFREHNEIQPMDKPKSYSGQPYASDKPVAAPKAAAPAPKPTKPVSSANMDKVQMEEVEDRMVIHFPYKSSRKEDNAAIDNYLGNLAAQLISTREKVTITGHTDFVGEPAENTRFGLTRANGIRDILVKKGVPKAQIICKSMGDRKPVATNDTPYGRYLNRRVEIRVTKR